MSAQAIDQRVETLELELANVAKIIELEGRLNKSRFDAVSTDLDGIKRRLDNLTGRMDELPTALARTVTELLAARDKRD